MFITIKDTKYDIKSKLFFILLLILPFIAVRLRIDNDLWFMLNHGEYIIQNGWSSFQNITEPFTIHEGFAFSFQKWLTCLIFYELYSKIGTAGVIMLVFTIALATEFVCYKLLLLLSDNNKFISALFTCITLSLLFLFYETSRPQIFTYLFIFLEIYILEKYIKDENQKILLWLPVISCLWMQLHSTQWEMMFLIFCTYLFDFNKIPLHNIKKTTHDKRPILIITIASFIAGMINPYGFSSFTYMIDSMKDSSWNQIISECKIDISYYIALTLLVFVLILLRLGMQRKHLPLRYIYLYLGMSLLGLSASRNIAYILIAGAVLVTYLYKDVSITSVNKVIDKFYTAFAIMYVLAFMFLGNYQLSAVNTGLFAATECKDVMDEFNSSYVGDKSEVRFMTDFNSGAYIEYLGYKAYIDPRAELFIKNVNKKEDIMAEYTSLMNGEISYIDMQKKYSFDYWIVGIENNDIYDNLSNDGDWKEVNIGEHYAIFQYIGN